MRKGGNPPVNPVSPKAKSLVSLVRDLSGGNEHELRAMARDTAKAMRDPGAALHAFAAPADPEAWLDQEASRVWSRFGGQAERPALFGVPVGVKDIIHAPGLPTRAGSTLPAEALAGEPGGVVRALLDLGAVVAGKTATTEFAFTAPSACVNPHDPTRTPGGSSSGSAAAVAAGILPLALGTQTVGSTIRPASFCGVVGFKPSQERLDVSGIIPFSPTFDQVGLFTADTASMCLAARWLLARWLPLHKGPDVIRLGLPVGPFLDQAEASTLASLKTQLSRLPTDRFTVVELPCLEDIQEIRERHVSLMSHEFAGTHEAWFARYGELYRPQSRELIEKGRQVTDPARLRELRDSPKKLRKRILEVMKEQRLDAFVCPSAPGFAPKGLTSTGDSAMNLVWTHAGLPCLSLPYAQPGGLPLGIQIVGRYLGDELVLDIAGRMESCLWKD